MPTMVRGQFSDWLTTSALPFLRSVMEDGKFREEWYTDVFRVETTDRPHEQYTGVAKFGTMVETDEGAAVTYDSALQGFDKTLTPVQYSLGFKITKRAFDDDRIGVLREMASDLRPSHIETRNILAADIFNNGFNSSFTGADGLELFSTAHLHEDNSTFRNELATAADFSITSFRTAMVDFRAFTDGRGKKLNLTPQTIMVPPDVWHDVAEVVQSPDRPDTANRAKNVYQGYFGGATFNIKINDYLTDLDSWFLIGPKEEHGLVLLDREPYNTSEEVDFDTRTIKVAGWATYDIDWVNNGKGVYGSPGA